MKEFLNKDNILYLIIVLIIIVFGSNQVFPKYTELTNTFNNIRTTKAELTGLQMQLKDLQEKKQSLQQHDKDKIQELKSLPIEIYKSMYNSVSAEDASIELLDTLVDMIKLSNNTIQQIAYEPVNSNDVSSNVNKLKIDFKLRGSYLSLQNLFQRIYTWKYLAGISKVSLVPDSFNREILNADLTITLFVEH